MKINGIDFVFQELNRLTAGRCAMCEKPLPPVPPRTHTYTCDAFCHNLWMKRLIAEFGETKILTFAETGKRYVVPTIDILERGIDAARLVTYPEAP